MNNKEAIKEIKNLKGLNILDKTINFDSEMISKKEVLNIVKQLDEPEKPVVPQYVADYIDSERNSGSTLSEALGNMYYEQRLSDWFYINSETFAKAWLYGYEVEKEKLYTVELPNPNAEERPILYKIDGKVHIIFPSVPCWRAVKNAQLTESEIKQDFEWAWKFAEEVKE